MTYLTNLEKIDLNNQVEDTLNRDREFEVGSLKDEIMKIIIDNSTYNDVDLSRDIRNIVINIVSNIELLSDNTSDENSISIICELEDSISEIQDVLRNY